MKLITRSELKQHSESELARVFRSVSARLVSTEKDSPERRNALATLENIQRERAQRLAFKPPRLP